MSRVRIACLAGGLICLLIAGAIYTGMFSGSVELYATADAIPRSELVVDLPEDAGKWNLGIVYSSEEYTANHTDRQLRAAFAAEPRLRSLAAQTTTTVYKPSDPMWRERFAPVMGSSLPQVWLTDQTGRAVYKASGPNLPANPTVLANEIQTAIQNYDCRPRPAPRPTPTPQPVQPSVPDLRPDPSVAPVVPEDQIHPAILILGVLGGGLLGAFIAYKRQDG